MQTDYMYREDAWIKEFVTNILFKIISLRSTMC